MTVVLSASHIISMPKGTAGDEHSGWSSTVITLTCNEHVASPDTAMSTDIQCSNA